MPVQPRLRPAHSTETIERARGRARGVDTTRRPPATRRVWSASDRIPSDSDRPAEGSRHLVWILAFTLPALVLWWRVLDRAPDVHPHLRLW